MSFRRAYLRITWGQFKEHWLLLVSPALLIDGWRAAFIWAVLAPCLLLALTFAEVNNQAIEHYKEAIELLTKAAA
jgi:hypothetical protein